MTTPNSPAYPVIEQNGDDSWSTVVGLTKREHFAAIAMQGLLAGIGCQLQGKLCDYGIHDQAVEMADLIIAALNK